MTVTSNGAAEGVLEEDGEIQEPVVHQQPSTSFEQMEVDWSTHEALQARPLSKEDEVKFRKQLDYFFSDHNLAGDRYLRDFITNLGGVTLQDFITFHRIRKLFKLPVGKQDFIAHGLPCNSILMKQLVINEHNLRLLEEAILKSGSRVYLNDKEIDVGEGQKYNVKIISRRDPMDPDLFRRFPFTRQLILKDLPKDCYVEEIIFALESCIPELKPFSYSIVQNKAFYPAKRRAMCDGTCTLYFNSEGTCTATENAIRKGKVFFRHLPRDKNNGWIFDYNAVPERKQRYRRTNQLTPEQLKAKGKIINRLKTSGLTRKQAKFERMKFFTKFFARDVQRCSWKKFKQLIKQDGNLVLKKDLRQYVWRREERYRKYLIHRLCRKYQIRTDDRDLKAKYLLSCQDVKSYMRDGPKREFKFKAWAEEPHYENSLLQIENIRGKIAEKDIRKALWPLVAHDYREQNFVRDTQDGNINGEDVIRRTIKKDEFYKRLGIEIMAINFSDDHNICRIALTNARMTQLALKLLEKNYYHLHWLRDENLRMVKIEGEKPGVDLDSKYIKLNLLKKLIKMVPIKFGEHFSKPSDNNNNRVDDRNGFMIPPDYNSPDPSLLRAQAQEQIRRIRVQKQLPPGGSITTTEGSNTTNHVPNAANLVLSDSAAAGRQERKRNVRQTEVPETRSRANNNTPTKNGVVGNGENFGSEYKKLMVEQLGAEIIDLTDENVVIQPDPKALMTIRVLQGYEEHAFYQQRAYDRNNTLRQKKREEDPEGFRDWEEAQAARSRARGGRGRGRGRGQRGGRGGPRGGGRGRGGPLRGSRGRGRGRSRGGPPRGDKAGGFGFKRKRDDDPIDPRNQKHKFDSREDQASRGPPGPDRGRPSNGWDDRDRSDRNMSRGPPVHDKGGPPHGWEERDRSNDRNMSRGPPPPRDSYMDGKDHKDLGRDRDRQRGNGRSGYGDSIDRRGLDDNDGRRRDDRRNGPPPSAGSTRVPPRPGPLR